MDHGMAALYSSLTMIWVGESTKQSSLAYTCINLHAIPGRFAPCCKGPIPISP